MKFHKRSRAITLTRTPANNTFCRPTALAQARYRTENSAGESIRWVSEQMGHEDETVTLKHYSKWLPSLNELAGTKAAAMFRNAKASDAGHRS
jgi:integrase